jgi:hypothetical protein
MKKLLCILLIVCLSACPTHPMQQMFTTASIHCYEYLKNYNYSSIDFGKVLLVATVGVLVLDKIFPIFPIPVKTQVILPGQTFNQTEVLQHIKNGVAEGINGFHTNIYTPFLIDFNRKINALTEETGEKQKLNDTDGQKEDYTQDRRGLKENEFQPELEGISEAIRTLARDKLHSANLPKGSFDTYAVALDVDIQNNLIALFRKLETNFFNRMDKKFIKLKKKNPLYYSQVTTTRSRSDDEADAIFGALNDNEFLLPNLIDSDLLSTQEGLLNKKSTEQNTPPTPRTTDLDIIPE